MKSGGSLARNLFLAYHWLSPLLNDNEKQLFIRPMLVRIAEQIMERLEQDDFKQFPGHSHTSRLPAYLGLAGLVLYREHNIEECELWLNEAITIYRGILPFYGGIDGSWVEGSFYASTYSKWFHPLFLSIERLSDFSFYEHPFYQNFVHFAQDFIAPEQDCHPFSDGFWCTRDGKEWPGFFSQNPLRIYVARFGDAVDYQQSQALEHAIKDYRLHLLDVVPTIKQIEFEQAVTHKTVSDEKIATQQTLNHYYAHAGLGKFTQQSLSVYYRASAFGNSSHRHADQGNIGLFEDNIGILIPTGSYGYRFGSKHHSEWTRQTIAHNLPLIDDKGQKLDDPSSTAQVIERRSGANYHLVTLDLTASYAEPVEKFYRSLVLIEDIGLIFVDCVTLSEDKKLNWRLHSPLKASLTDNKSSVLLASKANIDNYRCNLLSHPDELLTIEYGYEGELNIPERAIESDASKEVVHLDWLLPASQKHIVVASCVKDSITTAEIDYSTNANGRIELAIQDQIISI
ncbi:heparinase II/III family protein [Psychromonas sp. KJ10-10]|uniref:heparinase II/III domain-containing protein n=1 Tax=Psychromonas sp. KJ10-10 TaxID=3391823 RepID=UPI0039B4E894